MKEEILKRAMFAMPLSKEAKNSGIMAGFEDDINEMDSEDEMPIMERTPQNPEIMMNTLRGDMRSTDARYMELAQMVGEEAAMETPPEVLAMLQGQFAMMQQPQGGIGALPQGGEMMPPPMQGQDPMAMPGQDPMAMQGGAMPMDQGPMMPPGGEGMSGPFPQGGAEQAPPTPDGMAPQQFAIGGLAQGMMRGAQALGPRIAQGAQSANAALGRMFMSPQMSQPVLENVRGAGGRFTAQQIASGGNLMQPTFTQGLNQGLNQLAAQYPKAGPVLSSAAAMLAGFNTDSSSQNAPSSQVDISQIPGPSGENDPNNVRFDPLTMDLPSVQGGSLALPAPAVEDAPAAVEEDTESAPSSSAIELGKLAGVPPKPMSKIDRIRASRDEYAPLFQELMGDNKADMKTNALLMLADAGFKFAGATEPTMAMSLAKSIEGIPKGFAALIAQANDRKLKLDSASLTQAITDVNAQDAFAKEQQMEVLKGDYKLLLEQAKKGTGVKVSDGGVGGRITEDINGFVGFSIDPNDPSVRGAIRSEYTLRDTDNPFVQNMGEAPTTTETDKGERIKLGTGLRSIDNALSQLNSMKRDFTELYSPGTWVTSKVNNILVPVTGGLIRPDVDQAKAATSVSTKLNRIQKAIASANDTGRVAVQEQEWVRDTTAGINDPQAFFTNKELAAAQLNALETELRNSRQNILTQLGYEKNNYVMTTPNTGTQSDPFAISQDPEAARRMYTFLKGTVGKAQNADATVYLQMPNGKTQAFTAGQLRDINLK